MKLSHFWHSMQSRISSLFNLFTAVAFRYQTAYWLTRNSKCAPPDKNEKCAPPDKRLKMCTSWQKIENVHLLTKYWKKGNLTKDWKCAPPDKRLKMCAPHLLTKDWKCAPPDKRLKMCAPSDKRLKMCTSCQKISYMFLIVVWKRFIRFSMCMP